MAEHDQHDRTEAPSARRLQKAREEGQVVRSRELTALGLILAVGATLVGGADRWHDGLARILRAGLAFDRHLAHDSRALGDYALAVATDALVLILPILGVAMAAGLLGSLAIGGWNFTTSALSPKFGRLNPLNGLGNMISLNGLTELVKAVVKALVMGAITLWLLNHFRDDLAILPAAGFDAGIGRAGAMLRSTFFTLIFGFVLVAAIDVPLQFVTHIRSLRMSKEELRQESREIEGDPQIRGRIRQIQRERARRRMMAAIPTADVVVTNPTHFAVALKYDGTMSAPTVVAKGVDAVAAKIREIADAHRVPRLEAPALARALYRHAEVGETIPQRLFEAVAVVLAYVYQLREAIGRGASFPLPPGELHVPADLDPVTASR